MELTRYQFELLTYIEKRESFILDHRAISDEICISGNQVDRDMKFLKKNGYVEIKDNVISITEAGKEALEPYRVRRAVILAAGFGSRMMPATADRPKPLVTVNGKRIIETLLDALVDAEIEDITIVRGYKKDRFDEILKKYPFVKFIDNDDYDKFNNISSAILIGDSFKGGSYLCEADLYITNPAVITKYQYTSNILGSWSLETDDWSFKMDDKGHIRNYQKGNTYCWNYYGISYWTPEDCEKLNRDWANLFETENGKDIFWEQVPLQLKPADYHVEIRPCNKSDIMEIDNYYELVQLDPKYR